MNRPITSARDIVPAYKELPNKWLKVLFWALVPIGIVLAAALAVFLWQKFFPKEPEKAQRDAKVKQFTKASRRSSACSRLGRRPCRLIHFYSSKRIVSASSATALTFLQE